jgi:aerobic carbon-monoxide dehydrogenase small subunit
VPPACLPGAVLTRESEDRVEGDVAIKFGPMSTRFAGTARLERDARARRGVLEGAGRDSLSHSRAAVNVVYVVQEDGPCASRVGDGVLAHRLAVGANPGNTHCSFR